jgi:hypothetical protein
VLPLHECASESVADTATAESVAEPLHSIADPAAATLTETSSLCVRV